jgi:hypothetical protein
MYRSFVGGIAKLVDHVFPYRDGATRASGIASPYALQRG